MHQQLQNHLDKILEEFSKEEFYSRLLEAKEEFFSITGKPQEEDEDYEGRMRGFTDWYLFQYISKKGDPPPVELYLQKNNINGEIKESFLEYNHSLFEYMGENFSNKPVLKDILHDKKINLSKDFPIKSLLKGDLFLGRTLHFTNENFLMNGLCVLPKEAKSIFKKVSKKVRKLKEPEAESFFLMKTEALKTKWQRYGHVDIEKIFIYPDKFL